MLGSVEEVEALLPLRFTSTSSPTREQVEWMLAAHSANLELRLRALGLKVPPPGTSSYAFLSRIVVQLTCADILRRKAVEEGQAVSQMAELMNQDAQEMLKLISAAPQAFAE